MGISCYIILLVLCWFEGFLGDEDLFVLFIVVSYSLL